MKNSVELQQERASLITAQKTLVNLAKAEENRSLSSDENVKFDGLQSQIESLDTDISRALKFEANERSAAAENGKIIGAVPATEPKKQERFSFIRAINNARKNKEQTGAEKAALEAGVSELQSRGLGMPEGISVAIPSEMLMSQRAQTVTGDSGTKGGEFVATVPSAVMPLLPSLKIEEMGATVMTGLTGNLKLLSGDEFTFSYVAENAEVSPTDVVVDGVDLKPRRLSGVVDISNQWLIQTTPAAEAHVKMLIANGIQNAITTAFINGPGGVAPTGLYTTITTNVQTGGAADPTWDDVVGLETLIKSANATEANLYYLSDPSLMGKLKTTKKDAGSGIFLSEGGNLNGRNHIASTLVPTLDAGASHPLIYGDFGQATVGFWSGVSFIVDTLTQATKGKTRLIFNVYNDVAVANEKAFAIRKNFTV
jgi:HK97 family phage major capsid protein